MRKEGNLDVNSTLKLIKYLISEINYAGKISKGEDMKILLAFLDDLFKPKIALCDFMESNPQKSHYGIP